MDIKNIKGRVAEAALLCPLPETTNLNAAFIGTEIGNSRPIGILLNVLVVVCGIGFLIFAYQQESRQRLMDKALALREQAMTLHQAVSTLSRKSIDDHQQFIDAVCRRMSDEESPGHHIVVEINGKALQSRAHHRDTEQQLHEIHLADKRIESGLEVTDLLVGKYVESGITVFIGEDMANIRGEIRWQALLRSCGLGTFVILLIVAVNFIVHKLVHRPLHRLIDTIDDIAAGNYGKTTGQFEGVELKKIAGAVNSMSLSLARAEAQRKNSLDRARRVQENLLPDNCEESGLDFAFFHRAAEVVAGDYLDIFQTKRGTTILCVADVVGHGIAPAMIATMIKVLLLEAAEVHDNPEDMLALINQRFIAVNLAEDFATVFLAEWRPTTRTIRYVSAGHEPALLLSKNLVSSFLNSTGPLIGIDSTSVWESRTIAIAHGDQLTCWTDGITEARNARDDLLGHDRLVTAIQNRAPTCPQQILDAIDQVMSEHVAGTPPFDDCTVLAIRFP